MIDMIDNPNFQTGRHLIELLRQGRTRLRVQALAGSSPALLAALAIKELHRPVLIIAPEAGEADKLADELGFYLDAIDAPGRPYLLPERMPYRGLPAERPGLRAAALAAMLAADASRPIAVAGSAAAVLARTPPPEVFHDHLFELAPGSALDRDEFLAALVRGGYTSTSEVMEPGDFSVRGGILDVFLAAEPAPLRIELWGDEIASLRRFDPADQKSTAPVDRALAYPLKEIILGPEAPARAREHLNALMIRIKEGIAPGVSAPDVLRNYGDLLGRIDRLDHFPGLESLLPAFYRGASCALDYLDPRWLVIRLEPFLADQARARDLEALEEQWRAELAAGIVALAPAEHYTGAAHAAESLRSLPLLTAGVATTEEETGALEAEPVGSDLAALRVQPELDEPIEPLLEALAEFSAMSVKTVLVSPLPGKAEHLRELLAGHGIIAPVRAAGHGSLLGPEPLLITVGPLQRGFLDRPGRLAMLPEAEVFGEKIRPRRLRRTGLSAFTGLFDLAEGDYVVHEEHGIGIYRGLTSLSVQWIGDWDFVNLRERPRIRVDSAKIEYADGAHLFVPVTRVNQISKYTAPSEAAPSLDALGGSAWERYKRKVSQSVREFAEQLLRLYASRRSRPGIAFPAPDKDFREFEETFEYEETPDQLQAIEDVIADMTREQPMDRVVCGDVGYGKTEVALRAAFLAALSGRQVAILAPTTILAQQHSETFSRRLAKYPLVVRSLSRFLGPKEQKEVVAGIKAGTVDVVIGTHRLLSKDVEWNDLGLIVVDEEHRFGVRHKERLRQFRATVDTLTLTATPIPRTLYMAVSGLRDLSIIDTPPADRLAVHTELTRADDAIIREAIERELRRNGQVFFVHNRVQTITATAGHVSSLVPSARVAVAHGQMDEKDLERIMHDFVNRRFDVLVCSAIIESGLDIPTVNTMIIDHADQFGLAQLYQLRGRIGRSRTRGYCYLLVPTKTALSREAAHRLKVIKEFTELGSGFRVAAHDLEIRGAGNLLGSEQSGHIYRIGIELYMRLLEDEIKRQKGEPVEADLEPEIKLPVSAYLPDEYVPDQKQRLTWYKRLARAKADREVSMLKEELIDRYGACPGPVLALIEISRIKARLYRLRATELAYTGAELSLALADDNRADIDRVLALAAKDPTHYRLAPDNRFFHRFQAKAPEDLFPAVHDFLNQVMGDDTIES
jgi:transcription-repair coupling factor (superfamily II helicase)